MSWVLELVFHFKKQTKGVAFTGIQKTCERNE